MITRSFSTSWDAPWPILGPPETSAGVRRSRRGLEPGRGPLDGGFQGGCDPGSGRALKPVKSAYKYITSPIGGGNRATPGDSPRGELGGHPGRRRQERSFQVRDTLGPGVTSRDWPSPRGDSWGLLRDRCRRTGVTLRHPGQQKALLHQQEGIVAPVEGSPSRLAVALPAHEAAQSGDGPERLPCRGSCREPGIHGFQDYNLWFRQDFVRGRLFGAPSDVSEHEQSPGHDAGESKMKRMNLETFKLSILDASPGLSGATTPKVPRLRGDPPPGHTVP